LPRRYDCHYHGIYHPPSAHPGRPTCQPPQSLAAGCGGDSPRRPGRSLAQADQPDAADRRLSDGCVAADSPHAGEEDSASTPAGQDSPAADCAAAAAATNEGRSGDAAEAAGATRPAAGGDSTVAKGGAATSVARTGSSSCRCGAELQGGAGDCSACAAASKPSAGSADANAVDSPAGGGSDVESDGDGENNAAAAAAAAEPWNGVAAFLVRSVRALAAADAASAAAAAERLGLSRERRQLCDKARAVFRGDAAAVAAAVGGGFSAAQVVCLYMRVERVRVSACLLSERVDVGELRSV
jgi:hypothetical protein